MIKVVDPDSGMKPKAGVIVLLELPRSRIVLHSDSRTALRAFDNQIYQFKIGKKYDMTLSSAGFLDIGILETMRTQIN